MPSSFGVTLNEGKQANTAQSLLRVHCCLIFLALLIAVVSLITTLQTRKGIDEMDGLVFTNNNRAAGAGEYLSIGFSLIGPALLFFCARHAIKNNSASSLQGLCLVDSYCAYCSGLGVVMSIIVFIFFKSIHNFAKDIYCAENYYTTPNEPWQSGYDNWPFGSQADCLKVKNDVESIFSSMSMAVLISAALSFIQLISCALAAAKANQAQAHVNRLEIFTGSPPVQIQAQGQMPMGVAMAQPVAVGAPVGAPVGVAVGAPVQGAVVVDAKPNV